MGRTNPTFRNFFESYERQFGDYRRGLRHDGRKDFDRLFERARAYADAAGYANHLDRDRLVLFSMALGHEAALRERRERIDALAEEVDDLVAEVVRLESEVGDLRAERSDGETGGE